MIENKFTKRWVNDYVDTKKLNLTLSTEYKVRFAFSIVFFIFSIIILWAIGSYSGWLPNFGFATRFFRSIGESLSESMSSIGAYNLLFLLSLIGFINGLAVLIAVIYRNFIQKK